MGGGLLTRPRSLAGHGHRDSSGPVGAEPLDPAALTLGREPSNGLAPGCAGSVGPAADRAGSGDGRGRTWDARPVPDEQTGGTASNASDPRGTTSGWAWDPSLYAGSAEHYAVGRAPYPQLLADLLRESLQLDGRGRLLDVGCGPGSLTLLLAPLFADVIGVDADPDMLVVARRLAAAAGLADVHWRHLRAEDLPADLPPVDVVTFAQSFHWMDRPRVAAAVRRLLAPGGTLVHVSATTHEGVPTDEELPHPQPPRAAIGRLVARYLGDARRAGQGVRAAGPGGGEDAVYRAAGFTGPELLHVPGRVVEPSAEQVVASVHSLSSAAPHLFGDRLAAFDADLRQLLHAVAPDGRFAEQLPPTTLHLWR